MPDLPASTVHCDQVKSGRDGDTRCDFVGEGNNDHDSTMRLAGHLIMDHGFQYGDAYAHADQIADQIGEDQQTHTP